MKRKIYIVLCLCLLLMILAGAGVVHAGYNHCFEIGEIFIANVVKETDKLKVSVDYCTSAMVIKNYNYNIVNRQMVIKLYGGWIYPWDKGISDFSIDIASDLYDQVVVRGRQTEAVIPAE